MFPEARLRTAFVQRRALAGRSSSGSGPKRGGASDLSVGSNNEGVTKSDVVKGEEAPTQSSAAIKVEPVAVSAPRKVDGAKGGAQALFVLPLYRKPAFPGFYQVVQVSDQEVLDFLFNLRTHGQGEYLGGFMTKELKSKVMEEELISPLPAGTSAAASRSLRRDAGSVGNVSELEEVGTVLQVINVTQYPNISGGQVVIMPHRRIRRTKVISGVSPHVALACVNVEYLSEPEVPKDDEKIKALHVEIIATMKELLKASVLYNEQFEQVIRFYDLDHPLKLADLVCGMSLANRKELQGILTEDNVQERLTRVFAIVKKDLEFAKLQSDVKSQVEEKLSKGQRQAMLKMMMKQIMKELGIDKDDKQTIVGQFRDAIKDKQVPEEANKVIESEINKLSSLEPSSSEYNVCRTYLEWLTCLPWGQFTVDNKVISKAENILDEDHYGLEDVKERILEHIAVSFLKKSVQGKIICLVGPPGVGKTSIGKSIARALDRKFFRFSVGGLHDVAELRGHRRTYVGAMPGKLIQCLKITQSSNPVVLIDEIDKLGRDSRGDPSSALLEILDPEQNGSFRDHYLDVPVDLSHILFVCTANLDSTIPGPLLDRMEIIRIAGYVFEEKTAIAKQYLIPQTQESSGIGAADLVFKEDALAKMVTDYAREAGVRQLRKLLEKITRKVALNIVRSKGAERQLTSITTENLSTYIGQQLYMSDKLYHQGTPTGVIMGLAWTSMGGATLYVEARGELGLGESRFEEPVKKDVDIISGDEGASDAAETAHGGGGGFMTGSMKVTGQLGSVMTESSSIALTYARMFVREVAVRNTYLERARIHLNVPEGATPKDGPSAGVTMCTALVSLALDSPVREDFAMTGELTLMGKVLKVGGIREKVIAARREGVSTLVLPRQNEADYVEMKEYLRAGLTAHFVDHYDEVYRLAFEGCDVPRLSRQPKGLPTVDVFTSACAKPPLPHLTSSAGETGGVASDFDITTPIIPMTPLSGDVTRTPCAATSFWSLGR